MPFNQTGQISRAIVAVAGKPFRLADYFSGLLGPPAGPDPGAALWQGRWPLPEKRWGCPRPFGRDQETHRVSSARAGRCPV